MSPRVKWIILCLLLSASMGYYFFGLVVLRSRGGLAQKNMVAGYGYGNDLYPIWLTTRDLLAHKTDPYTTAMEHRIETGLYGRPLDRSNSSDATINYRGFSYPLYSDILAAPLALLSFRGVQILFSVVLPVRVGLGVACNCAALGLNLSRVAMAGLVLVTLFSCQVLAGVYALQPTLIVATLIAAALAALRHDKFVLAGVLLALSSVKPHLIVLPMLWLLLWTVTDWARRKRLLVTFVVVVGILLLISEVWLPRWWIGWVRALPAYRQYTMPPLSELLLGRAFGRKLTLALLGLGLGAAVRWRRAPADSRCFFLLFAFLLAITVGAISSSTAVYDQILLLPGALWLWFDRHAILRASRPIRIVAYLVCLTFVWQWFFAPALAVASSFLPWTHYPPALMFPLITTGSFPLGLMSLLGAFVAIWVKNDFTARNDGLSQEPAAFITQES